MASWIKGRGLNAEKLRSGVQAGQGPRKTLSLRHLKWTLVSGGGFPGKTERKRSKPGEMTFRARRGNLPESEAKEK